jgi:hypothetical protein
MEIIGLSGYARSGKDEAASVLVEEFGFIRVAFADKLREFLYALNPLVYPSFNQYGDHSGFIYVQDVIDKYGWGGYKETHFGPEIRRLLQRLGTEAGRNTMWDSIWIDAAFTGLPEDAKVVVTDARFPNEAEAIKSRGGGVVRINRKGIGPAVGSNGEIHPSETSLDDWDFDWSINNDWSLEQYHEDVRYLNERSWF